MEERKIKEIEYYDSRVEETGDFEGFDPFLLESFNFLKNYFIENFKEREVLDFGCGNGIHSVWLQEYGEITGIDLSEKSLDIAKKRAKKTKFIKMDCEKLEFPDDSFDVVFDGGTFSSLNFDKSFKEMLRVLKKDGALIGIETLGHNPILNFKRKINKLFKKRTEWAESHIFKMKDFEKMKEHFEYSEAHFFHLVSWIAFPFLSFKTGRSFLNFLQKLDETLISFFPFLKRYSFKIVFIFKNPRLG